MNKLRETFLLHRIRSRQDRQAYAELYDAYVQRIYRFIYMKVKRRSDAEELTADVFASAWTYLCTQTVTHLNAYLFTVARRTVADYYRKHEVRDEVSFVAEQHDVAADGSLESDLDLKHEHGRVLKALATIHEDYREIISMRYLEQLETKEIAEALGKTPNNVRVTLHRAVGALKAALIHQDQDHASNDRDNIV